MTPPLSAARQRFLDAIAEATPDSPRIGSAFRAVDRADFVPTYFLPDRQAVQTWPISWRMFSRADGAEWADHLYAPNAALVTKLDPDGIPASSSTDPLLMVEMLKALQAEPGQRILEIGTGTGYNAAITSCLVGDTGRVITIDLDDTIASAAKARLRGYPNVLAEQADGIQGFAQEAPYDGIMVTANAARVEQAWIGQLALGGRLVVNLNGPIVSALFAGRSSGEQTLTGRILDYPQVGFTPLYGHPTDMDLLIGDIGSESVEESDNEKLAADVAGVLVYDEDVLAFIQFALEVRRSWHEIVGRDGRQPGVAFHRGGKSCWLFLNNHGQGSPARAGGDGELLADVLRAHARWKSSGSPRRVDLELEIGADGTRVAVGGRLIGVTRLWSPAADLALSGFV